MLKIFHNPRCKHSRAGLEYLKQKTDDYQIREYLKDTITNEEIKEILLKINIPLTKLIRTQEEYFKKSLKGKNFNEDEWIRILLENPKLLQRPIVVAKHKAVLANPPDAIDDLLYKYN